MASHESARRRRVRSGDQLEPVTVHRDFPNQNCVKRKVVLYQFLSPTSLVVPRTPLRFSVPFRVTARLTPHISSPGRPSDFPLNILVVGNDIDWIPLVASSNPTGGPRMPFLNRRRRRTVVVIKTAAKTCL